jgi:hypothetical protein
MTLPTHRALTALGAIGEMNDPQLASVFWLLADAFMCGRGRGLVDAIREHPDANATALGELVAQLEDIELEARG